MLGGLGPDLDFHHVFMLGTIPVPVVLPSLNPDCARAGGGGPLGDDFALVDDAARGGERCPKNRGKQVGLSHGV